MLKQSFPGGQSTSTRWPTLPYMRLGRQFGREAELMWQGRRGRRMWEEIFELDWEAATGTNSSICRWDNPGKQPPQSYSYRMTKVSLYDLKIIFILSNSESEGLALGRSPTVNTSRAGFSVRNKIEENWEWTSWHRIFYYSTSPIDEYYKHSRHSPSFRYIFLFIPLDILYGEKIVKMSRSDLKRVQKRKKKTIF